MCKLTSLFLLLSCAVMSFAANTQTLTGKEAAAKVRGSEYLVLNENNDVKYVRFAKEGRMREPQHTGAVMQSLGLSNDYELRLVRREEDKVSFTHYRYRVYYKSYELEN